MAQVSVGNYPVPNSTGQNVRTDINENLADLFSTSSGSIPPPAAGAATGQLWIDTSTSPDTLKVKTDSGTTSSSYTTLGEIATNFGHASSASPTFTGNVGFPAGSNSSLPIRNAADTDTGIYWGATNELDIRAGDTDVHTFSSTASEPKLPLRGSNGSNSAPSFSFASDTDLGLYRSAANTLGITTGGTERAYFSSVGLSLKSQNVLRLYDSDSSNYAAIQAPSAIGSNYTLTLPADDGVDGEVLTTNGSGVCDWGYPAKLETARTINGVSFDGSANITIPAGGSGSGSAGQVVSTTKTDATTGTTSGGVVNAISGLSVAITPTSTSSKVLVIATLTAATTTRYTDWFLSRGGTRISAFKADAASNRNRSTSTLGMINYGGHEEWANSPIVVYNTTLSYLDSPSTTNPTTYAVGVHLFYSSSDTWSVNRSVQDTNAAYGHRTVSTITAIEVL